LNTASGRIPGVQPCHDTPEASSEAGAPGVTTAASSSNKPRLSAGKEIPKRGEEWRCQAARK